MLCLGINAPAWLFSILGEQPPTPNIVVFGLCDFGFLAGVLIVWYLVGRALDHRMSHEKSKPTTHADMVLWNVFLAIWGIGLFVMALAPFRSPNRYGNPVGNILNGILFFAWSLLLMTISEMKLSDAFRRKKLTSISLQ